MITKNINKINNDNPSGKIRKLIKNLGLSNF